MRNCEECKYYDMSGKNCALKQDPEYCWHFSQIDEFQQSLREYNKKGEEYLKKHRKQIEEFEIHMKNCKDPDCICKS